MKTPTVQGDLEVVKKLLREDRLDWVIQKLDPSDILGSLRKVPKEAIRLLTNLLSVPDIDKKIEALDPIQREPAKALLGLARKHKGDVFVKNLKEAMVKDERVLRALGLDITALPKIYEASEAKIRNTIDRFACAPQLMLKTRRVFASIAFFYGDSLLFRADMDLDDLLWTSAQLLDAASSTLNLVSENAKGVAVRIDYGRCEHFLKQLKGLIGSLPRLLRKSKGGKAARKLQADQQKVRPARKKS